MLLRICSLRGYARMREVMKSDGERERDAKPHGPMAKMVARVQHLIQTGGGE